MKKSVKTLCDILYANHDFLADKTEKTISEFLEKSPKAALLSCPYPLRFLGEISSSLYIVSSYGGVVNGNEMSLHYAVKSLQIPLLIVLEHEDCSAVKGALKGNPATKEEALLHEAILPCFEQGKGRRTRDHILKHIDYQVSLLLEDYHTQIKEGSLLVIGVFCDAKGCFSITNYNGLRGLENLSQALPELDSDLFLG